MDEVIGSNALYTVVFSPNWQVQSSFKGYARSISSANSEGPFDILPKHENFVTMIGQKVTIYDTSGRRHEITLEKGLIEASNNLVKVFIEF